MRDAVGAPFAAARARSKARLAAGVCALAMSAAPAVSLAQSAPASTQNVPPQSVAAPSSAPPSPPRSAVSAGLRGAINSGPPRLPDPNAHGPIGEDRLSADELFVEADQITRNDKENTVVAKGHVLARYQDHTLRAEELVYDTTTGQMTANGHAEITNPDGTVEYGEHVVMDDKMHAGVVKGFAGGQGAYKVAAAEAIRRNEDVNELSRVVFTACAVCTPKGQPATPTWSIQAQDAVQDKAHQVIVYRDAVLKVKGVPLFWSPVFWTPDPSNPRESGLLPPRFLNTQRLGFSWEQPYLWVISPSQDLEIRPQINTNVAPMLNFDWRKQFYSGEMEARFGYTYEQYFEGNGEKFGPDTSHSYILAKGLFNIDNDWRWGFSAEHSSDPTFFDRYDIQNVFQNRGLYWDDTRRLANQLYTVRQDSTSFLSVTMLNFQSLRIYDELNPAFEGQRAVQTSLTNSSPISSAEEQSALPNIAPLIDARWDPDFDILGGRLRLYGDAVLLDRSRASLNPYADNAQIVALAPPNNIVPTSVAPGTPLIVPTDPCYVAATKTLLTKCPGVSSQSASAGLNWRTAFTVQGLRLEPFLDVRGDVFNVQAGYRPYPGLYSPPVINPTPGINGTDNYYDNAQIGRAVSNLGVDLSYPLYRPLGAADLIIEPMAELILSPKAHNDPRIPNEDSQVLDWDETTLMRPNPYPGYDLYVGGPRASVGTMATLSWGQGQDAHLFAGREFFSETVPLLPTTTTLSALTQQPNNSFSDWVVYGSVSPINGLNFWTRERFNSDTGTAVRTEAAMNWTYNWTAGIVRYLNDDTGMLNLIDPSFTAPFPLPLPGRVEEAEAAGYVMATSHWGVTFDAIRDMRLDIWRRSEVGILYRDVCVDIELVYQRNETNPLGPSTTTILRLNFPISGRLGFLNYDLR